MANIFRNTTSKLPTQPDAQTVRVDMEQIDIGGRKSHLPGTSPKSGVMSIEHVANQDKRG